MDFETFAVARTPALYRSAWLVKARESLRLTQSDKSDLS